MTVPPGNGHSARAVDFDLHGLVGIRLIDATAREAAAVGRDLGPIQKPLNREPDIVIRFVDTLKLSTPIRYLGVDDAGFTDDAFLVLRSKHKARARVQIPFERLGQRCEIVCERGLGAVPLLIPIVNLAALSKGVLPLHASAFTFNGVGVLVTGWAKGGKTETLLAFTRRGAQYVGDEWIYLTGDAQHMYGIPEPVRLWDWHLQDVPELWALVEPGDRARLRFLRVLVNSLDWAERNRLGRHRAARNLVRRTSHLLKWQQNVRVPPHKLFGPESGTRVAPLQKVFLVASDDTSSVRVEPVEPEAIAQRMVYSLQLERIDLLAYYLKFRFAFPNAANPLIDGAEDLQRRLLVCLLQDKEAYAVHHPYPVAIASLFDAMSPFCN